MSIDFSGLHSLSAAEKLQLVEYLWDDLGSSDEVIPLPDWVGREAARRRDELRRDPQSGLSHEEVWRRIDGRTT